jgi:hypothetical protein
MIVDFEKQFFENPYLLLDNVSKIFGFNLDHSTAIYFRDTEFVGTELEMYEKIENYIKTYDIQWEH